ncbi:MAG: Nif3-like dinuclear metal center hexameric protein [Ferruginibacter sp.]|nr:Nif3-like dinuclear metal center hexameric protein [Ferruginibacter sp.]
MIVNAVITFLETIAPPILQEAYDNAGLLTGNKNLHCTGVLICLDCTEDIVQEAIDKKCNLVVAHHPIIFNGIKKITGKNYIERTIIKAIKNDIAIYGIHTNLDNVVHGVNGKIAEKLELEKVSILAPKNNVLQKLIVYVPKENADYLADTLFKAGAGQIGNYSNCSFKSFGIGSFTPNEGAEPKTGEIGINEKVEEIKLEFLLPKWKQEEILQVMKANHPYEEVAYDLLNLENVHQEIGSGIVGFLPKAMTETDFLQKLATIFKVKAIKHTVFTNKVIKKVALCGGAGVFLLAAAKAVSADVFVTSDVKYHEYFDAEGQLLLADIGHYESEQFTIELLFELLSKKFPNFAVQKTGANTNPVQYFVS